MKRIFDHWPIFATIGFTVYSQLIIRWRVADAGELPNTIHLKLQYVLGLLLSPWGMSAIIATFLAGVSWMLVLTKFEISYAFPFVSLNYLIVLLAGILFFSEDLNVTKVIGSLIVMAGILVLAKG